MERYGISPAQAFLRGLQLPGLGHRHAGVRARQQFFALSAVTGLGFGLAFTLVPPVNLPVLLLTGLAFLAAPFATLAGAIDAALLARRAGGREGGGFGAVAVGLLIWVAESTAVVVALAAMSAIGSARIAGDAMAPTLLAGEWVAVWKDYYRDHLPERGDVAMVLLPGSHDPVPMRILGLPGDSMVSLLGTLTVNGQTIDRGEDGDFGWRDAGGTHRNAPRWRETLPGGTSYHVLQSAQGLFRGTLLGASLQIPDGEYFVIGDNRDDTKSSWNFGFLPGEVLSDRPTVILTSADRGRSGRGVQP